MTNFTSFTICVNDIIINNNDKEDEIEGSILRQT